MVQLFYCFKTTLRYRVVNVVIFFDLLEFLRTFDVDLVCVHKKEISGKNEFHWFIKQ